MTEQEIKAICKLLVEHGQKPLTIVQKELLKQEIDKASNWEELFATVMLYAELN